MASRVVLPVHTLVVSLLVYRLRYLHPFPRESLLLTLPVNLRASRAPSQAVCLLLVLVVYLHVNLLISLLVSQRLRHQSLQHPRQHYHRESLLPCRLVSLALIRQIHHLVCRLVNHL